MKARAKRRQTSELMLVRALADGDLSALGELYDRHAADVRRFAVRATGARDVAEDVTQETFLLFMASAKRFDPERTVRPFLIGIAGKLVLRRQRSVARRLRKLGEILRSSRPIDDRTPERDAIADEELANYRRALERLSPAKRVVVIMADVEGMSGADIATALGVTLNTVWTRLHHARVELRSALRRKVRP